MTPRVSRDLPVGVQVRGDVESRNRRSAFRARVRWTDPVTKERCSKSESFTSEDAANAWIDQLERLAAAGVDPATATMTLADYGISVMEFALRGLEAKTRDPYLAGWRHRVVPTLGHLAVRMVSNGAVDRAVNSWIADGCGFSTVKNSLAVLVRVMEQALRDGLIERTRLGSRAGSTPTARPRTSWTTRVHLPYPTGKH